MVGHYKLIFREYFGRGVTTVQVFRNICASDYLYRSRYVMEAAWQFWQPSVSKVCRLKELT